MKDTWSRYVHDILDKSKVDKLFRTDINVKFLFNKITDGGDLGYAT